VALTVDPLPLVAAVDVVAVAEDVVEVAEAAAAEAAEIVVEPAVAAAEVVAVAMVVVSATLEKWESGHVVVGFALAAAHVRSVVELAGRVAATEPLELLDHLHFPSSLDLLARDPSDDQEPLGEAAAVAGRLVLAVVAAETVVAVAVVDLVAVESPVAPVVEAGAIEAGSTEA